MNHTTDNEESLSATLDGEESLSATLDGEERLDLPDSGESSEVGQWKKIGEAIRQFPSAPAPLTDSVMEVLKGANGGQRVIIRQEKELESPLLRWLAVTTSCVAILLVCFNLATNLPNGDPQGVGIAAVETHLVPENWEVLVVTLDNASEKAAVEVFRESAQQQGMQMLSVGRSNQEPETGSDVLMVSGDLSTWLNSIVESGGELEAEMNPEVIDGMRRDELLDRFAESMKTPTRSDKYFGDMLVLLPGDNSLVVRSVPVNEPLQGTLVASSATPRGSSSMDDGSASVLEKEPSETEERPLAAYLQDGSSRPVLVVFRSATAPPVRTPTLPDGFRPFPHL